MTNIPRGLPELKSHNGGFERRRFLSQMSSGFTGLVLGSMLHRDGLASANSSDTWAPPTGQSHFPAKAKSVIWLFMIGGVSQMESFDPKPALDKYAGLSIEETPHANVLTSPLVTETLESGFGRALMNKILPLQVPYRRRGESGIEISDWFPHIGDCVDDVAFIRSMWTTDNNHGAQYQFHTGRNKVQGLFPSLGSWVHYGLGSLNESLPQYVVLGQELGDCCGGIDAHGAAYLGSQHAGVQISDDPRNPIPYIRRNSRDSLRRQQSEFALLNELNRIATNDFSDNPAIQARIAAYELAFRMQKSLPEAVDISAETKHVRNLYGVDDKTAGVFGKQCLVARRLVERGTRFVQIFHGSTDGAGQWDAHNDLKPKYDRICQEVDQPIGGLLKDLKQRGLLDETLVVFVTEFGRTPGVQGARKGRDHHPYGFSVWMAGGGVKGGITHGATDELGFHAIENRHYVTDIHATILHQLGLDSRLLEVPGQKRLEIDHGHVIHDILA